MKKNTTEMTLWKNIVDDLKSQGRVGAYGLDEYISQLRLVEDTGSELIVEYPADLMIDWVEINYVEYMVQSAARVLNSARSFQFVQARCEAPAQSQEPATPTEKKEEEQVESKPLPAPVAAAKPRRRRAKPVISGLNENNRFDNFIVGENNAYAYSAATAVAKYSGSGTLPFNPFFIYGESGMGKTHLMHAIGNAIREQDENAQVLYVTSEAFTNAYIEAIGKKGDALNAFRRKYRRADVLLIDDVQFLSKASKTQDEFFHTFNALFESGKQIILCSDCPASEITNMDKRLSSRFEQGMTVCLKAPSYETRMAILKHKMSQWTKGLVSNEVLDFLARHITSSVRSLEGALTRIATIASFSQKTPSVAEARAQLSDLLNKKQQGKVSIAEIQRAVADSFDIRVADLNGRRRTANIAHPRQVAMFLARQYTQCSLQDIGAAFGGRDHGTVIHAARSIEEKMHKDNALKATIEQLAESWR